MSVLFDREVANPDSFRFSASIYLLHFNPGLTKCWMEHRFELSILGCWTVGSVYIFFCVSRVQENQKGHNTVVLEALRPVDEVLMNAQHHFAMDDT